MPSDNKQSSPPSTMPISLWAEKWTLALLLVISALYVLVARMQPAGEGWGRGWNLVAYLLYGSPAAWITGALACWRTGKNRGPIKQLNIVIAMLGFIFPVVALMVMRARS